MGVVFKLDDADTVLRQANTTPQTESETMKINGSKIDTTGIKFISKKETCDPITFSVTANMTINGVNYSGDYCGDVDETRMECKEGAYLSLRSICKKNGINV